MCGGCGNFFNYFQGISKPENITAKVPNHGHGTNTRGVTPNTKFVTEPTGTKREKDGKRSGKGRIEKQYLPELTRITVNNCITTSHSISTPHLTRIKVHRKQTTLKYSARHVARTKDF